MKTFGTSNYRAMNIVLVSTSMGKRFVPVGH